ncbi:MAG: hypothetical protein Q8O56_17400 [Solirubrobacteraceae bacterium]|nr:hypothetical protein [Solirubrobacteraceae bacterium]
MRMVPVKHGRAALAALAATAATLGVLLPGVALVLAPAMLLLAFLLLGIAPGEQLLERMRARRMTPRRHRAPRALTVRHAIVVRRMTSPAASALAMRPPPAAPALIS